MDGVSRQELVDALGNAQWREKFLLAEANRLRGFGPDFFERCRRYYAGEVGAEVFL